MVSEYLSTGLIGLINELNDLPKNFPSGTAGNIV